MRVQACRRIHVTHNREFGDVRTARRHTKRQWMQTTEEVGSSKGCVASEVTMLDVTSALCPEIALVDYVEI